MENLKTMEKYQRKIKGKRKSERNKGKTEKPEENKGHKGKYLKKIKGKRKNLKI